MINFVTQISYMLTVFGCSVAKSCLTFYDLMDCSLPGSSVHGILQARILEWVAIFSSRGSSPPGTEPTFSCVSCIGRQDTFFTTEPPGKPCILRRRKSFSLELVWVVMADISGFTQLARCSGCETFHASQRPEEYTSLNWVQWGRG